MKIKNNLLILERSAGKLELNKSDSGDYVLEGIFGEIDVKNKNNRIYTESEYVPQIEALQDKIKSSKLLGELDHPANFDISLKNVSHIIEELTYDKDSKQVKGRIRLLDTEQGRQAKSLVDAGVPLQISSRAAGAVESNGKVKIKQLFTYDLVADPGFANAELTRVNESFGIDPDGDIQIYEINNIENTEKTNNIENKKQKAMVNEDTSKVVSVEDFNSYSKYLSEEIKELKAAITSQQESNGNSISSEELDKIKEYTNYIAETLDKNISYTEHTADGVNKIKEYTNYLAESFNESAASFEALNEKLDKVSAYTEYVAETVNKNLIMEDRAEDISKADMERGEEHPTELGKAIVGSTIKASIQEEWNKEELDVEIAEKEETTEVEEDRAEDIENDITDLGKTKTTEDEEELQTEKASKSQEDKEVTEDEEENEEPEAASDEDIDNDAEAADAPVGEDVEVEESEEDDTDVEVEESEEDDTEVEEALATGDSDKGAGKEATDLPNDSKDVTKELTDEVFHGDVIDDKTIVVKDKEVMDGALAGEEGGKVVLDEDDKTDMMDDGESPLDEDRASDIEDDINNMGTPKSLEGEEDEKVAEDLELDIISEEELALNQYKDEVEAKLSAIIENNNAPKSTKPSFFNFVSESVQSDFGKLNEDEQSKVLKSVEGRGFLSESQIVNLWSSALTAPVEEELPVVKMMPAEYREAFDNLSEAKKASVLAQAQYHRTETSYQVKNFWQTRDLREDKHQKVMEKLITENTSTKVEEPKTNLPYDLGDMKTLINERFKYKK